MHTVFIIFQIILLLSLIPLSLYDIQHRRIPNEFNLFVAIGTAIYLTSLHSSGGSILPNLIAGGIVTAALLITGVCGLTIGGGDIKLLIPLSFFYGGSTFTILFLIVILEILHYIFLKVSKRSSHTLATTIPMAPFLTGAVFIFLTFS